MIDLIVSTHISDRISLTVCARESRLITVDLAFCIKSLLDLTTTHDADDFSLALLLFLLGLCHCCSCARHVAHQSMTSSAYNTSPVGGSPLQSNSLQIDELKENVMKYICV